MTSKYEEYKSVILATSRPYRTRGVTIKQIINTTSIGRITSSKICKDFVKEGYFMAKRYGKEYRYFPTEKAYESDTFILSLLFKKKVLNVFFKTSIIRPEDRLHDFIVKVGLFVTYTFLIASDPKLVERISKDEGIKQQMNVDKRIIKWIDDIISPQALFEEFRYIHSLYNAKPELGRPDKKSKIKSSFEMSDYLSEKTRIDLFKLYPNFYNMLDEIYYSLEKDLKNENDWSIRHLCEHDYIFQINKSASESKVYRCSKCDNKISINLTKLLTERQLKEDFDLISSVGSKENIKLFESFIKDCCRYHSGKHFLYCIKLYRVGKLFVKPDTIRKKYVCKLCNRTVAVIFKDKEEITKILDEVKQLVGDDKFSLDLFNAIAVYINNNLKNEMKINQLTFADLFVSGAMKGYPIQHFPNDRLNILKILERHRFIRLVNKKEILRLIKF